MNRQYTKRQRNNRKLFLGVFLPLLAVTFVACTAFAVLALRITNRYVSAETSRITGRLADSIELKFVPAITNVEDFAVTAAYTDDGEILNMVIHMMGTSIPYARGIYYGTGASRRNGGVFYDSANWLPPEDWEPSARGWYKEAIARKGEIAYSVPYVDADTGLLCVGISRHIVGPSGAVTGVVSVDILLHKLTAMIDETTPPSAGGRIYIVNNDGTYLTNPDMSRIMTASYFDESPIPVKAEDYLIEDGSAFQDKTRYYAASKIGESPWYVVVEGPLADFTGRIKRIVYIFEIALVVFCIACSLLNLRNFKAMRRGERETGEQILAETQNLAVAAKQNAATGQDQSTSIKEIVATMEDNSALAENIAVKIQDVAGVAEKTSGDVADGVSHLEKNVAQLHEIAAANQDTIDGIKVLGDRINNIWDIVTLINSVADQAKIIAFKADLEASSAGEAGKSFHIVATEIRRLSDNIIDSIKEIKDCIDEIQKASDALILDSEKGTSQIDSGYRSAKSLESGFESIMQSSDDTAGSTREILEYVSQLSSSSEQILLTLRQIADGIENFSSFTANISSSSENVRQIASLL